MPLPGLVLGAGLVELAVAAELAVAVVVELVVVAVGLAPPLQHLHLH